MLRSIFGLNQKYHQLSLVNRDIAANIANDDNRCEGDQTHETSNDRKRSPEK